MDNSTLTQQLQHIKRALRGVMNGPVSSSMRSKGLGYKVIFGVELPRLQQMAEELPHTFELASALWKEDIRECRLLAGMLMPVERMDAELATICVEQMRFQEEAECSVMHLFSRAKWASSQAFEWIARDEAMFQLCGYLLLARLFMQGAMPSERDAEEFLDQTATVLTAGNSVARAAGKALTKFMDLGPAQERAGERLLRSLQPRA